MHRLFVSGIAAALLLSGSAFAQTAQAQNQGPAPAQNGTNLKSGPSNGNSSFFKDVPGGQYTVFGLAGAGAMGIGLGFALSDDSNGGASSSTSTSTSSSTTTSTSTSTSTATSTSN